MLGVHVWTISKLADESGPWKLRVNYIYIYLYDCKLGIKTILACLDGNNACDMLSFFLANGMTKKKPKDPQGGPRA